MPESRTTAFLVWAVWNVLHLPVWLLMTALGAIFSLFERREK